MQQGRRRTTMPAPKTPSICWRNLLQQRASTPQNRTSPNESPLCLCCIIGVHKENLPDRGRVRDKSILWDSDQVHNHNSKPLNRPKLSKERAFFVMRRRWLHWKWHFCKKMRLICCNYWQYIKKCGIMHDVNLYLMVKWARNLRWTEKYMERSNILADLCVAKCEFENHNFISGYYPA